MVKIVVLIDEDVIADFNSSPKPFDLSEYDRKCEYITREFETQAEADAYVKAADDIADGLVDYMFVSPEDVTGIDE